MLHPNAITKMHADAFEKWGFLIRRFNVVLTFQPTKFPAFLAFYQGQALVTINADLAEAEQQAEIERIFGLIAKQFKTTEETEALTLDLQARWREEEKARAGRRFRYTEAPVKWMVEEA